MKDIEARTAIAKALYARQQERCDQNPIDRYILPPWDSLPDDSKGYWMRDAEAVEAALKALGWLSPADATAMAQAAQAEAFEKAASATYELKCKPEDYRDIHMNDALDKAFDAIRALTPSSGPWQRVPEGSVVVPKEPTEAMCDAGCNAYNSDGGPDEIYRAMLAEVKK